MIQKTGTGPYSDFLIVTRTREYSPCLALRAQIKNFLRILRRMNCKCGHGLDSHLETGKCTNHIGFASACPCSSYEPQNREEDSTFIPKNWTYI